MSIRYVRRGENFNEGVLNRPVEDAIEKINEEFPTIEEIGDQADVIDKGNFVYSFRDLTPTEYIEFSNQYISRSDSRVASLLEDFHENRFWQPDLPIVGDGSYEKTQTLRGGSIDAITGIGSGVNDTLEVVFDVKFSASKAMVLAVTSHRLLVFNTVDMFEGGTLTPVHEVSLDSGNSAKDRFKNAIWGRTDSYILFSKGDDLKSLDVYTGDVTDLATSSPSLDLGDGCIGILQNPESPGTILHVNVGSISTVRGFRERHSIREFSGSFSSGDKWTTLTNVGFIAPSGRDSDQQPLCFEYWQSPYPVLYSINRDPDDGDFRMRVSQEASFTGFNNLFTGEPFVFPRIVQRMPKIFLLGDRTKSRPSIVAAYSGERIALLSGYNGKFIRLLGGTGARHIAVSQINESSFLYVDSPSLMTTDSGKYKYEVNVFSAGANYKSLEIEVGGKSPSGGDRRDEVSLIMAPYDDNMILHVYSHPEEKIHFEWSGKFNYDFTEQFYFKKPATVKGDLKQYVRVR